MPPKTMLPKRKRGRPAKKPAQPAASEAPATPAATIRMSPSESLFRESPIPSEATEESPNTAKRRLMGSDSFVTGDNESIAAEVSPPPRKKRGRPRKQQAQPAAPILPNARAVSVIRDSQEDVDVDVDGIGDDKERVPADGFTQELKDAMREIFIGNAIEQGGGL